MDKPFIEERGLKLVAFEERHILPFAMNLSEENLREFEVLYNTPPVQALESCIGNMLTFAVEADGKPLAVTGLIVHDTHAVMWCLFSKDMKKKWISFARASSKLVKFYSELRPVIMADVWTENEMIHQWLVYLGFMPEGVIEMQNGQMVIRFVRCNTDIKSAQTATSRPVLH